MKKRFERPRKGRIVAGVARGIADYFGVSVVAVRLVWILLFLPGGFPGLLPYIVLWLIMPSEEK